MKPIERAMAAMNDLFDAIEKAPRKTVEQKISEGEKIQETINSEPDLHDGWSKAFGDDNTPLPRKTRWVLGQFGKYSPMSMRGIREAIYKHIGEGAGALHLNTLEAKRLVKVKEVGGRSMWEIT